MTIAGIREICLSLQGTTEDIKWEDHLCFNVGGKMYLITAPDLVPVSASFKVTDEQFEALSEREGCMPAPYLARYKWIRVDALDRFSETEWRNLLTEAHHLVFRKLPAGMRKKISGQ